MKIQFLVGFIAILSVLFFANCESDEGGENPTNTPVTFLATGARFDYYYTDFFYEDTLKTIVEEQIGVDTFLVRNYSETIPVIPTQYWVLKNSALYSSFRLRDPASYVIECKFNKPKGTSWKVKKGGTTYTYTIDEINATITTGLGEINDAVKIKITSPVSSSTFYQYISPSVGPIGSGNFEDIEESIRLVKYKIGIPASTNNRTPSITYGNFNFLKVGNYWKYNEETFVGEDVVTVTVDSKLANKNIYKVKVAYESGGSSNTYWYEDNGYLMVYEEGEKVIQADPIYVSDAKAVVGQGWGGLTPLGTFFIYKVESLNETVDTYFGNLSATGIYVTGNLFSTQVNYWNANKGNVLVTGLISRDIIDSNARQAQANHYPFIPIIGIWR